MKSGAAWRAGDAMGRAGLDFLEAQKGEAAAAGKGGDASQANPGRMSGGRARFEGPIRVPLKAAERGIGRVTVRLRVSRENYELFRRTEAAYLRWREDGTSFLMFLCQTIWDTWGPTLETTVKYGEIYERDRFECGNPTCTRTDLTPHHIVFRSQGGDDRAENLVSLCVWCHLEGVHGRKIAVKGAVPELEWQIGARPIVVVKGRERVRGGWKEKPRAA